MDQALLPAWLDEAVARRLEALDDRPVCGTPLGGRRQPLEAGRRGASGDRRRRPRLAQRLRGRARADRRSQRVRRRAAGRGLPLRGAARHGRLEPRAGGARGRPRHRERATSSCTCSTRPTRPPSSPSRRPSTSSRTLFVVSSKSGGTTETASFHAYFYERVRAHCGDHAGHHFVAITDEGTSLQRGGAGPGLPRHLREPLRHRRPVLGAQLLRHGAGGADRRGPRSGCSTACATWPWPAGPTCPAAENPGLRARCRPRRGRARRSRQAHPRHRASAARRSAPGWSSSSPRAPARRARASCRWTWSRSATPKCTARTACSPPSASPVSPRRARRAG